MRMGDLDWNSAALTLETQTEVDQLRGRAEVAEAELKLLGQGHAELVRELRKYLVGLRTVSTFNLDKVNSIADDIEQILNGE